MVAADVVVWCCCCYSRLMTYIRSIDYMSAEIAVLVGSIAAAVVDVEKVKAIKKLHKKKV